MSSVYARVQQGRLDDELRRSSGPARRRPSGARWRSCPTRRARLAFAARALRRARGRTATRSGGSASPRSASTRSSSQGTGTADLRKGPGHYPEHAAAGRARDGRDRRPPHDLRRAVPRHRQARARRPDRARRCRTAASPTASSGRASCRPTATWVSDRVAYDRLVLTACHPLYSAAQRIVVFARLRAGRSATFGSLTPWTRLRSRCRCALMRMTMADPFERASGRFGRGRSPRRTRQRRRVQGRPTCTWSTPRAVAAAIVARLLAGPRLAAAVAVHS